MEADSHAFLNINIKKFYNGVEPHKAISLDLSE